MPACVTHAHRHARGSNERHFCDFRLPHCNYQYQDRSSRSPTTFGGKCRMNWKLVWFVNRRVNPGAEVVPEVPSVPYVRTVTDKKQHCEALRGKDRLAKSDHSYHVWRDLRAELYDRVRKQGIMLRRMLRVAFDLAWIGMCCIIACDSSYFE